MKPSNLFYIVIALSTFCIFNVIERMKPLEPLVNITEAEPNSITFIVGSDKNPQNPFYQMATDFFYFNPQYKTEIVLKNQHSLEEIVNYLNSHVPPNGTHWEVVNIVNHSSEFGLNMPLYAGGQNVTSKIWQDFYAGRQLKRSAGENHETSKLELPSNIQYLSKNSLITFWGCSFGQVNEHMNYLKRLFTGKDGMAKIRSPQKRLFFEKISNRQVTHYYADEQHIYAAPTSITKDQLTQAFQSKYPNSSINWQDALSRPFNGTLKRPSYDTTDITIRFYAPLEVLLTYPTLKSFMLAQPEIMESLNSQNLNFSDLSIDIQADQNNSKRIILNCKSVKYSVLFKSKMKENRIMAFAD